MFRDNRTLINSLFEDAVLDALSRYGINPGYRSDYESKITTPITPGVTPPDYGNLKHQYLREEVLNRIELEWNVSGQIANKILYDPITGTYDSNALKELVSEYVRNAILEETKNLQIDAERKIFDNLVDGEYFEKGGLKKLVENVTDVVSPETKKYRKLLGTKLNSKNQDAYREAVLDVLYPNVGNVEEAIARVGKATAADKKAPDKTLSSGDSVKDYIADFIDRKTEPSKLSSYYLDDVKKISKEYSDLVKADQDELKNLQSQLLSARIKARAGDNSELLRIESESNAIRNRMESIYNGTFSGTHPLSGTVITPRNFQTDLALEQEKLRYIFDPSSTVTPSSSNPFPNNFTSTPVSLVGGRIVPVTEIPSTVLMDRAEGKISYFIPKGISFTDVFETNPEQRIKLDKLKSELVRSNALTRATIQSRIDLLEAKIEKDRKKGLTLRDPVSIGFNRSSGSIEITDVAQDHYSRAVKNLGKGLSSTLISRELDAFRIVDSSVYVTDLKYFQVKLASKAIIPGGGLDFTRLSKEEYQAYLRTTQLLKDFEGVRSALSISSVMTFSKYLSAEDRLKFNVQKANFIANIGNFESDPEKQRLLIDALNREDTRAFRKLASSGTGGKSVDLKYKRLIKETEAIANLAAKHGVAAGTKEYDNFVKNISIRSLHQEVINSAISRRFTENVIYATQLITDTDYAKKEVKKIFKREVFTYIGSTYVNPWLDLKFGYSGKTREFVDATIEILSDPEFRKDPGKVAKAILKKNLKKTINETIEKKFLLSKSQILFKIPVELDFVDLITDFPSSIKGLAKKIEITKLNQFLLNQLNKYFYNQILRIRAYYRLLKLKLWRFVTAAKNYAISIGKALVSKLFPSLAARFAAFAAAGTVPVIGQIVLLALVVLPILLRPLLKEGTDFAKLLKDALKAVALGPCLVIVMIWILVLVPIVSAFADFWSSIWNFVTSPFTNDNLEMAYEGLKQDVNFATNYSYNQGVLLIDNLVNTNENKCVYPDGTPKYKGAAGWDNLKPSDFENLNGDPNINCNVLCNAQQTLATLYPGPDTWMNCNASADGQRLFNPAKAADSGNRDADKYYWCTWTLIHSYRTDFPEINSSTYASVYQMRQWFISKGNDFIRFNLGSYTGTGTSATSTQCISKSDVAAGAVVFMTPNSDCSFGSSNHVAMFLRFEGDLLVFINSNDMTLKGSVKTEDCGGGKVRLKPYGRTGKLKICDLFQINPATSGRNITCQNPVGSCPISAQNNY